jgi:predicted DNA-binding transcriptional regulator YafY
MTKKSHPYAQPEAFQRLMLLIATLVKYPGVGAAEPLAQRDYQEGQHHNALEELQEKFRELAQTTGIELSPDYPSPPTLRKDLGRLREYGILEPNMYRWGYYLGTGVMTKTELRVALNALESLAKYQADPQVRQLYHNLTRRLQGLSWEKDDDLFYPIRQNLNRSIESTDPEEMITKQQNAHNLFSCLETLESAIIKGQAIEISRHRDPYHEREIGMSLVWPLQLIYHNIAWYLLYEECKDHCFVVVRLSRFRDYCQIITAKGREITAQKQSLEQAHRLLDNGWGLNLGSVENQRLELDGKLNLIPITVRFFPPVSLFIAEGDLRHPKQKLKFGQKDTITKQPKYVDYSIELPPRSLNEFSIWLQRYGANVQVISPPELKEQHHQMALSLLARYQSSTITH